MNTFMRFDILLVTYKSIKIILLKQKIKLCIVIISRVKFVRFRVQCGLWCLQNIVLE